MLEQWIAEYGYVAVLLGTFLEGETILALAGFAAHQGYLRLDLVMAASFLGSFAGDQLAYSLGRRYGERLLRHWPSARSRLDRVNDLLERNATLFLLGFRFLYGLRLLSPVVIALSDIRYRRFLLLNAAGAAIWTVTVGTAGYLFGHAIEAVFGRLKALEERLLVAAVVVLAVLIVYRIVRRRLIGRKNRGAPNG